MERIHSSHQQQEPDDVSYFFVQSVLNNIICVLSKVWCQVVILVISVTGLLLFMYFFPVVMLYFAIGIFSLYGAWGVYRCASAGLRRGGCGRPEVRETCSGFLGILFPMTWLVTGLVDTPVWRWNWLIHVIIGACVCIDGVAQVRPTFKLVACTSVILLVYDVFFVFVSRLFTSDGVSIMEKTLVMSIQRLKLLGPRPKLGLQRLCLSVPAASLKNVYGNRKAYPEAGSIFTYNQDDADSVCGLRAFSMLGFGDVIVPGFYAAYCFLFDLIRAGDQRASSQLEPPGFLARWLYGISTMIGYVIALILAFLIQVIVPGAGGQPALLYLVPAMIGASLIVATKRKELREFCLGLDVKKIQISDISERDEEKIVLSMETSQFEIAEELLQNLSYT
ncbi:unnamed protein product [Notodromas monacha]|uniref:Signal peptide peptidase-like 2B n=1 Tax=Notodromas monacha TaxID=399045 RepID=A0A7R9BWE4_9CRUS|nr:unnamed protein product [Notodromas monacha]CAG0921881.1 unnamed protein product [Notodromas monacha]